MRRTLRHTLLLWSLLGLLGGCGQLPGGPAGEAESISGTITAPPGRDVAGTQVFACYENERDCASLGNVSIQEPAASASYQLGVLPVGSYGVYALKDADGDGSSSGNGDFFGYYNPVAGESSLVTPPAENIDIQMTVLTGASKIPQTILELQAKIPDVPN